MKRILLIFTLALFMIACGEKAEETQDNAPETMGDAMSRSMEHDHSMDSGTSGGESKVKMDGNKLSLADFTMVVPDGWVNEEPTSSMRLVQFHPEGDEKLKIIGFYFGNQPNMVRANIDRWKGQFVGVDNFAENTINDDINFVKITGTFKKTSRPMDMASEFEEAENYMMLAAIVPSNEGPYYFKAVGPTKVMEAQTEKFKSFLASYKKQ
jgi:hypothetical protein